jgi:hypothetical protein
MEIQFLQDCGVYKEDQIVDMIRDRAKRYIGGGHAVELATVVAAPAVSVVEPEEAPEEEVKEDKPKKKAKK